jgi:hypothetical protein
MEYKECSICLDDKDLKHFRKRTNGILYSVCRVCENKQKQNKRFKNKIDDVKHNDNVLKTTDIETKKCNNCGKILPIKSFRLRKHNNTRYSRCSPCEKAQTRARRERNKKTPEEILKKKMKNDSLIMQRIINETGIDKSLAQKALKRYEEIIISEFSHVIDIPDYIEEKTLKHIIKLVDKIKNNNIPKKKRIETEKKVSLFIKNNKKNGLTQKQIINYRKKCLNPNDS